MIEMLHTKINNTLTIKEKILKSNMLTTAQDGLLLKTVS